MAEEKKLGDAAKKILDADDEFAIGFCAFHILDQDGYAKKTKGGAIEAPWHVASSTAEAIVLEAELPSNALFYLQVSAEDNNYFYGSWWLQENKGKNNVICNLVPKENKTIQKELDGKTEFEVEAQMPLLKNSTKKLIKVKLSTIEAKFVTKVSKAQLTVPRALWTEFKEHRLTLWKASKVWKGEDKGGDDEKKEEGGGDKDE
eukprot:TRINITY_DN94534_c0_g1_i1.p1 TRINITY_DN94534_c0_g1~~TRINITY_DN94534_c0_g1_i1.p1  ORF type:complete len:203 (-),score=71.85 TRINITY_DN94534_c0_g1_i1:268-876(-)